MSQRKWSSVWSRAVLLGCGLLAASGRAAAAGNAACSFAVTTGVNFGVYNPLDVTPLESAGLVAVTCTNISQGAAKLTYTLSLQPGNSGSFANRYMLSGAERLEYNLYMDTARTQVWGDGTGGSGSVAGSYQLVPPRDTQQSQHTVYGRIRAGQNVTAGSYQDTIVCVLTF